MHRFPDVSVIVVTWNSAAEIVQCLWSLQRQSGNVRWDAFVVDNASTDATVSLVDRGDPRMTVLRNSHNRGFAAACNQALSLAKGRSLLFLNPDTVLEPQCLKTMIDLMDTRPDVGIAGCQLRNSDRSIQPSVRGFPTFISQALLILKIPHVIKAFPSQRRYVAQGFDYALEQEVDQIKGAFFFVRRRMLEAIGSFDERFWIWFEEVDLCLRAHQSGWKVLYTPRTFVTHLGGRSFRQSLPLRNQWHFLRSLIGYFHKHRPIYETAGLLVLAPIGLLLSGFYSLVRLVRQP